MKSGKPVIVVINKADSKYFKENMYDFYSLGFENYINISAEARTGIYDLQEEITKNIKLFFAVIRSAKYDFVHKTNRRQNIFKFLLNDIWRWVWLNAYPRLKFAIV